MLIHNAFVLSSGGVGVSWVRVLVILWRMQFFFLFINSGMRLPQMILLEVSPGGNEASSFQRG